MEINFLSIDSGLKKIDASEVLRRHDGFISDFTEERDPYVGEENVPHLGMVIKYDSLLLQGLNGNLWFVSQRLHFYFPSSSYDKIVLPYFGLRSMDELIGLNVTVIQFGTFRSNYGLVDKSQLNIDDYLFQ